MEKFQWLLPLAPTNVTLQQFRILHIVMDLKIFKIYQWWYSQFPEKLENKPKSNQLCSYHFLDNNSTSYYIYTDIRTW